MSVFEGQAWKDEHPDNNCIHLMTMTRIHVHNVHIRRISGFLQHRRAVCAVALECNKVAAIAAKEQFASAEFHVYFRRHGPRTPRPAHFQPRYPDHPLRRRKHWRAQVPTNKEETDDDDDDDGQPQLFRVKARQNTSDCLIRQ